MKYKFDVVKKYVRGENKGKRVTIRINLGNEEDIHTFLWDEIVLYDKKIVDYIIEYYEKA